MHNTTFLVCYVYILVHISVRERMCNAGVIQGAEGLEREDCSVSVESYNRAIYNTIIRKYYKKILYKYRFIVSSLVKRTMYSKKSGRCYVVYVHFVRGQQCAAAFCDYRFWAVTSSLRFLSSVTEKRSLMYINRVRRS